MPKEVDKSSAEGDQKQVIQGVQLGVVKETVDAKSFHHLWEGGPVNGKEIHGLPVNRQKPCQELSELGVTGSGSKGERCRHINRQTGVLYVLILFLFSSFGHPFMATVGKRMLSKLSL